MSSTENLPSCHRQEPQGEETQGPPTCMSYDSSDYSILERLGMPMQGNEQKFTTTPQIYVTGNYPDDGVHGQYIATSASMANPGFGSHDNQVLCMSNDSGFTSCFPSNSKLTMDDSLCSSSTAASSLYHFDHSPSVPCHQIPSSTFSSPSNVSSYNAGTIYKNYPLTSHSSSFDQGQYNHYPSYFMRAHPTPVAGAHVLPTHQFTSLPPPPEYPGFHHPEHIDAQTRHRSYEVLAKPEIGGSRSQPDMSNFVEMRAGSKQLGIVHAPTGSGSDKGSMQHSIDNMWVPRASIDTLMIHQCQAKQFTFLKIHHQPFGISHSFDSFTGILRAVCFSGFCRSAFYQGG